MNKKISPNYSCADWPQDLHDRNSLGWDFAIRILKDRFGGRYLNPLKILIEHNDKKIRTNVGFIVMSIDCLLIETLNQFYLGLTHTEKKYCRKNSDPQFRFHWQAFRDYFKQSKNFIEFKDNDDLCSVFYEQIRCGLLHQAESKVNSLINLKEEVLIKQIDDNDLKEGIIVNRGIFHKYVCDDFDNYFKELKNSDSQNIFGEYLRDNCNIKMKALCK